MLAQQVAEVYQIFTQIGKVHPITREQDSVEQTSWNRLFSEIPPDLCPEPLFQAIESYLQFVESYLSHTKSRIEELLEEFPNNQELDTDDTLVLSLEKMENDLKSILEQLADSPPESERVKRLYASLESLCISYVEAFQDLRWKILIRDGQLAPRTGETFSGRNEFLALIKSAG